MQAAENGFGEWFARVWLALWRHEDFVKYAVLGGLFAAGAGYQIWKTVREVRSAKFRDGIKGLVEHIGTKNGVSPSLSSDWSRDEERKKSKDLNP